MVIVLFHNFNHLPVSSSKLKKFLTSSMQGVPESAFEEA
jgi:hypothetical protein